MPGKDGFRGSDSCKLESKSQVSLELARDRPTTDRNQIGHRLNRPGAAYRRGRHGRLADSEIVTCVRPNSEAETSNGNSAIDPGVEARRIVGQLVKLHKAGAIKSKQDASFHANLIRRFGASFTVRPWPVAAYPGVPNGRTVPEPGKPSTPTAAQTVKVPRGLSRRQEAEFLARDLEEALAYELPPPAPSPYGQSESSRKKFGKFLKSFDGRLQFARVEYCGSCMLLMV